MSDRRTQVRELCTAVALSARLLADLHEQYAKKALDMVEGESARIDEIGRRAVELLKSLNGALASDHAGDSRRREGPVEGSEGSGDSRDTYFNTDEAAAYLSLRRKTLDNWRVIGGGPPFSKLGKRVAYRREDLELFAQSRRVRKTSEAKALGSAHPSAR